MIFFVCSAVMYSGEYNVFVYPHQAVREEVSRLLGSTSATSSSTATGSESSCESNNKRKVKRESKKAY
jgi:hypothetical protein